MLPGRAQSPGRERNINFSRCECGTLSYQCVDPNDFTSTVIKIETSENHFKNARERRNASDLRKEETINERDKIFSATCELEARKV